MTRGLTIALLILLGCNSRQVDSRQNEFFVEFKTSNTGQPITALTMPFARNDIQYVGDSKAIFNIWTDEERIPYEFRIPSNSLEKQKRGIKDGKIDVLVDTTHTLEIETYNNLPDSLQADQASNWLDNNLLTVSAFPVYIINSSKEITCLNTDNDRTRMIQEAKDKAGNWRPIEYYSSSFCGIANSDITIPPNSFVIVGAYKYRGEFHTDLRIKFERHGKVYYSNTYRGKINEGQFELSDKLKEYDNWLKSLK